MTPSRNTRSYTLRSVPSSPGRSFFCLYSEFFLVVLTPADLWYHSRFPRYRHLAVFVMDGRGRGIGYSCSWINHHHGVVSMIRVGRLPGGRHWELNQDNSLLSLLPYFVLIIIIMWLVWSGWGRLPGERHWELNQDNSLLSLRTYFVIIIIIIVTWTSTYS